MIRELMFKWFGLEKEVCNSCEVLRCELERAHREKDVLLQRLLENRNESRPDTDKEPAELKPIHATGRRFIPSAVRTQMGIENDMAALRLMQSRNKELRGSAPVTTSGTPVAELEEEVIGQINQVRGNDAEEIR